MEALSLANFEHTAQEVMQSAGSAGAIESTDTLETIVSRMHTIIKTRGTQVALVTIALRFEQDGKIYGSRQALANQSACYYLENLRALVRKTDSVFLLGHTFYFILPG